MFDTPGLRLFHRCLFKENKDGHNDVFFPLIPCRCTSHGLSPTALRGAQDHGSKTGTVTKPAITLPVTGMEETASVKRSMCG